jgi:hypothetical protein
MALEARAKTWEQGYHIPNVGLFSLHCRFTRNGLKIECGANEELVSFQVRCATAIAIAVGGQDPIRASTISIAPWRDLPAFVNVRLKAETVGWFNDSGTAALLAQMELVRRERLFVWRNAAELFVLPDDTSAMWKRLDIFCKLVHSLPPDSQLKPRISKADVPQDLGAAVPLLSRWAISDDQAREERIGRARTASLVALRDAIVPLLGRIDAYIDGFGPTPPESATRFGDLAQAAIEARQEVDRRSASR